MKFHRFRPYDTRLAIFAVWLISLNFLFSQSQITFRQLSVKEGLSQNSVVSIAQDSIGYLWIATQDGLNRYDGKHFTVYPYAFVDITKPDYSNLGKVYTDRQGGLWMIPINRVPHKFNFKSEVFEAVPQVTDASVIYQDRDLNIWIGTYSDGLYVLRPGKNVPEQVVATSEINGTIYNLTQNRTDHLMLAIDEKILEFDLTTNKILQVRPKAKNGDIVSRNFSDIVLDDRGRHWVGTFGDGLYYSEKESTVFHRVAELPFTDPLPADLNITDLYFDSKNRLWIATYGRGLYLMNFDSNEIIHFGAEKHNPKALHYNDILCVYEDYSGTLWFGTDGAGISYYDEYLEKFNSLTNYETPENINIDVVRAIAVDNNNLVWIGTSGKGLTRYDPASNSWSTYKTEGKTVNSVSSNRIMSLWVDSENNLWVGTQGGGLNIKNLDGTFTNFSPNTDISLSANTIWAIYKDNADRIWLGTREQGLVHFDRTKGEIEKYQHDRRNKNSIPSNNIRVMTADNNDNLWIGTESNGISFFNVKHKTFTNYRNTGTENSISSNNIKSLYFEAEKGQLWIGTNGGGLNVLDIENKKFKVYTAEQGLANNVIYAILPDEEGSLWLSSNKGITKFTPGQTWETSPEIKNYTNYAGLATEFNTGAYYKDDEGNLYFGGLDGFYWFRPDIIKENTFLPKTAITGFTVFDEPQSLAENLELPYDQNTISFTFSSLQFSLPEKNRYQYRLVNYDDDWVQSGNTNFARYTRLPPGDYRFQVKSSNYDGIWNETPVTYGFTIASPWYVTIYAKAGYLLLFLGAIYGVYAYLKWRLRMRLDLELKEQEAHRLKKLNDLKSKLYTDISHEFRTPLTLISGPVDAKLSAGGLTETDFSNFSMIKRNTNRLMALVDQLLHLAKLEQGKLKLKVTEGSLRLFLGMLATSFEHRAAQKNIIYTFDIRGSKNAFFDEDALEKIVTNLLSNAFKYGKEGGICHFEAVNEEGYLKLNVKNTVAEHFNIDLEKMFTRFYQKDEFAEGAGVGLSLVKELVQLHKGEVRVQLEEGDTISFQVDLPAINHDGITTHTFAESSDGSQNSSKNDTIDVTTAKTSAKNGGIDERPILLIVEDHKEVRDFLKSVWNKTYQIHESKNGKEGLKKALAIVPDLVVTDVRMPVLNGIELCNKLKTDERTSHIPIILLTASKDEEQELHGLKSGADDFITKPFKLQILQRRVENLIGTRKALRKRYSQELVLQAKDIAITPTDEIFLKRLQAVLDRHLSNPDFNTEIFSREIGMSRMQLHRKLLAFTGLSTTAFIRSQRLKQALRILKTSDATVSQVAYTVGFNTPSYFIKCFKETYKKTPSEFLQTTE